ncbi:MAG: creatininase family protein [Proteobacteria bacterium]|nr:creatininase family protein [Pseudomonadota bacterium]
MSKLFAGTMAEMTAPRIVAAAERGAGVLLPIGVMENHGPHLPIGTDAYIAGALCDLTRRHAAAGGLEFLIAPPFYWGINQVLDALPFSFRVRPEIAGGLLRDVIDTLVDNNFNDVLLVSHHGDLAHNKMLLACVEAQQRRGREGVRWLYAPVRWRLFARLGHTGKEPVWVPWEAPADIETFKTTGILGVHADEYETAAMVRFQPDTVDFEMLRGLPPTNLTMQDLERWRKGGAQAKAVTPDGYFGAPNPIDPDLWRYFDITARTMADALIDERKRARSSPI